MRSIRRIPMVAGILAITGCSGVPALDFMDASGLTGSNGEFSVQHEKCPCKIVGDIRLTFATVDGIFGFELNTAAGHLIFQPPTTGPNQNVALGNCLFDPDTEVAFISTLEPVTFQGVTGNLSFQIDTEPRGNHFEGVSATVLSPDSSLDAGPSVTTENRGLNIFPDC